MRWIGWFIFIAGGIVLSVITDSFLNRHGIFISFGITGRIFGLALIIFSFIVARNTGKTLAKYGKEGKVQKFDTNKFVDKGMYACMRHPMHFGLMMLPFGIAFLMNSFSYIIFYAPVTALLIIIMVFTIEEKEAISKFGATYLEYKKRVPAFNLTPQCLKKLFQCC
jgi:protein-S-isoprenylcysteine O-methyltransferase Ste14